MSVNGQDGNITRAQLIALNACFFVFAAGNAQGFPAGTEIATVEVNGMGGWSFNVSVRAPGDPLFLLMEAKELLESEWDADSLFIHTGNLENVQVPSINSTTVALGVLNQDQGVYVSTVDGLQYAGHFGLAKWIQDAFSTLTNFTIESATTGGFGGALSAMEQSYLDGLFPTLTITPYVPPAGQTETQVFPPLSKTIGSLMAVATALNFQRTMTAGVNGMPVCGRSAPPTS